MMIRFRKTAFWLVLIFAQHKEKKEMIVLKTIKKRHIFVFSKNLQELASQLII